VVGQDSNWAGSSFEFGTPTLEAADNGEEFFVVDLIVTFSRVVFFRHECYGVKVAVAVFLGEYAG
jgi:hypothetical protein